MTQAQGFGVFVLVTVLLWVGYGLGYWYRIYLIDRCGRFPSWIRLFMTLMGVAVVISFLFIIALLLHATGVISLS